MKSRLLPIMFLLLFIFMLGLLPVAAQDLVTNTPAGEVVATAEVTVAAPVETPAPPIVIEQPSIFSPALIGQLLLFLGLSAFAGGGIVAIILNFLGRKEVRDRVEDARNSWAPEQQQLLTDFTTLFERVTGGVLDFLKSVQDGQPNTVGTAQFEAVDGPALDVHGELKFLAKQLDMQQRHYPIPQQETAKVLDPAST